MAGDLGGSGGTKDLTGICLLGDLGGIWGGSGGIWGDLGGFWGSGVDLGGSKPWTPTLVKT